VIVDGKRVRKQYAKTEAEDALDAFKDEAKNPPAHCASAAHANGVADAFERHFRE
jgi:hypothetical protein